LYLGWVVVSQDAPNYLLVASNHVVFGSWHFLWLVNVYKGQHFPVWKGMPNKSLLFELGTWCKVHVLLNGKQLIIFLTMSIYRTSFSSPRLKCNRRQVQLVRSAMDASFGDMSNDSAGNFSILMKLNSYISWYRKWI